LLDVYLRGDETGLRAEWFESSADRRRPRGVALYRVCAVGPWRYGVTLLPGASRPDDERDEGKVDEVLRARSESGWELVNAVTERDGSDLLVFRRLAD
jgi:hypothetical protein